MITRLVLYYIQQRRGKIFLTGKLLLYMVWVAGEDVDTQRKGLVFMVWFDPSFNVVEGNRLSAFAKLRVGSFELGSVRPSAFHCCVPDTIVHRFVTTMMLIRIGSPSRLKMKVHFGTYELPCYHTISHNRIPIAFCNGVDAPTWLPRKPIA